MARQGNYVPNAGSNVNFASGLSSSLTDLSRSLLSQAQEKDRLEAKAREAAEAERRFGITEERQRANMLLDAAYKQQTAKDTAAYRKQQLDNAAEQARLTAENRAAQLALQERTLTLAEERAQREADAAALKTKDTSILGTTKVDYDIEDFGPNVQAAIKQGQQQISAAENQVKANLEELNRRRSFLDTKGNLSEVGQQAVNDRAALYAKENNLDAETARSMALQDVTNIHNAALSSTYEKDSAKYLNQLKTNFNRAMENLPSLITREEYAAVAEEALRNAGYSNIYSDEAQNWLERQIKNKGITTTADLLSSASASAKARYERNKDKLNLVKGFLDKNQGKGISEEKFTEFVSNQDLFGTGDRDMGISLYTTLKDSEKLQNVPAGVIRQAIVLTATKGLDEETLDPTDPKDLKKVTDLAISLANNPEGAQNFLSQVEKELEYSAPTREQVLGGRFGFTASEAPTVRQFTREDLNALRTETAKAVNNRLPETNTSSAIPDVSVEEGDMRSSEKRLIAAVGEGVFDFGPGEMVRPVGSNPNRKLPPREILTPRQELSRTIRSLDERITDTARRVQGLPNAPMSSMANAELAQLRGERDRLLSQILSLKD